MHLNDVRCWNADAELPQGIDDFQRRRNLPRGGGCPNSGMVLNPNSLNN